MGYIRNINVGEVLPGYPADAHNAWYNTYKHVFQAGGMGNSPGHSPGSLFLQSEVLNMSGAAIDADFPVLRLTKPIFTITDNNQAQYMVPALEGVTPAADTDIGEVGIVQGPIGNANTTVLAIVLGHTWCTVDVTDAAHTHAKPKADNTKLASGMGGARMLWKESGTGTKKAFIMLGGGGDAAIQWGVITTAASASTTLGTPSTDGRMTLLDQFGGTEDVELTNYYPDVAPVNAVGCINGGQLITWSCGTLPPE